jgi:hypothetical protein
VCALLGFLLLAVLAAVVILSANNDREAMARVEAHLAKHQTKLDDAVAAVLAANPGGSARVAVESLPTALRAAGVKGASCGSRHVTVIVTHTPDTDQGFRIWRGVQDSEYADEPTAIPGVYRFVYCDDFPESAKNRPD